MNIFSSITAALATIKSEESKLKSDIEKCLQRREDLTSLPLPRADFADLICSQLDTLGAKYPQDLRMFTLQSYTNNPMKKPNTILGGLDVLASKGDRSKLSHSALAFLFHDEISKGVRRAIDQWDWPADSECGPPRAEREKELAKLDAKISTIQTKIDDLRKQAADAGVQIN